jgi:hypothetical protein
VSPGRNPSVYQSHARPAGGRMLAGEGCGELEDSGVDCGFTVGIREGPAEQVLGPADDDVMITAILGVGWKN